MVLARCMQKLAGQCRCSNGGFVSFHSFRPLLRIRRFQPDGWYSLQHSRHVPVCSAAQLEAVQEVPMEDYGASKIQVCIPYQCTDLGCSGFRVFVKICSLAKGNILREHAGFGGVGPSEKKTGHVHREHRPEGASSPGEFQHSRLPGRMVAVALRLIWAVRATPQVYEILDNAVDEVQGGHASVIQVCVICMSWMMCETVLALLSQAHDMQKSTALPLPSPSWTV